MHLKTRIAALILIALTMTAARAAGADVVTDANAFTRPVHDRMPVLLEPADFAAWLGGGGGIELLRPAADSKLRMWPVSRRVNRTGSGDDDPTLLDEVAA